MTLDSTALMGLQSIHKTHVGLGILWKQFLAISLMVMDRRFKFLWVTPLGAIQMKTITVQCCCCDQEAPV